MEVSISCKNCNAVFTGKFCNNCGEKARVQDDKSLKHIFHEGFHFISHWDGTLLNNIRAIWTAPGKFSQEYCDGIRKKYFKPLSFILFLIIIYLLFPAFRGLLMSLDSYSEMPFPRNYIANKIAETQLEKKLSFEELAIVFRNKGAVISKFLLPTIIPAIAFISFLIAFRRRRFYFDHFIFATEIFSFFLMFGFLFLPLLLRICRLLVNDSINLSDNIIGMIISSVTCLHIYVASKRFFKFSTIKSICFSITYQFFLLLYLQMIYKYVLFIITINSV